MDGSTIKDYLSRLGCRRIGGGRKQVTSTCPFEDQHRGGKDTRPGFTVEIEPNGKSVYYCPACKETDTLEWLVYQRLDDIGPLKRAMDDAEDYPDESLNAKWWGKRKTEDQNEPSSWPEELVQPFLGKIPKYAINRGLTVETCKAWGLGYDKPNKRLIFPVRDKNGVLVGICGRSTRDDHPIKYANYSWDLENDVAVPWPDKERDLNDYAKMVKSRHLYGAHLVRGKRDIVVVEGQIDVVIVWQALTGRYDVVCIVGSFISDEQAFRLRKMLPLKKKVICFFDNDEAGIEGEKRMRLAMGMTKMSTVWPPEEQDPGKMMAKKICRAIDCA